MGIIKLALIELRKKIFFSLLSFIVCLVAFYLIISSITTVSSTVYQKKVLLANIGMDLADVIHLQYQGNDEDSEYIRKLDEFKMSLQEMADIKAVCEFDASGMYFEELSSNDEYITINKELIGNGRYRNHPAISRVIRIDEQLLGLIKGNLPAYSYPANGNLPIYPSIVFKELLPLGSLLTDEQFGDVYEVAGYLEKDARWADENDLIRFPLVDLAGYFIVPWSISSHEDVMTRLSSLHNIYVLTDSDDKEAIIGIIEESGKELGLQASGEVLANEYALYDQETAVFAKNHLALALFLSIMATSSIIAVFTTSVLLKKKQYGILIANGFNKKDILLAIATEISIIITSSTIVAWIIKEIELKRGKDIFKEVLLLAHRSFTLPICLSLAIILIVLATIIPANKIYHYQIAELIGGNGNGHY